MLETPLLGDQRPGQGYYAGGHTFALLDMRIPGEDELVHAQPPVAEQLLCDLLMTPDDSRTTVDSDRGYSVPEMGADAMAGWCGLA